MFRSTARVLAGVAMAGLLGLVAVAPAGASAHRQGSTQGITKDEITIVALVADLDGLRNKGFNLGPKLTTGNLLAKWQGYADAFGPINGRKVVVKPAVWDPLDNTTFDKACTQATQDNKPFVVVNGNGYRQSSIGCVTVDNKTPLFFGESVYGGLQKASGNRLVSLGLPSEVNATTTAQTIQKANLLPKTAKIGILSSNEPGLKAAGDAVEAALKKRGYTVAQKIEVNGLSGNSTQINQESAAAVATFKSAGVDSVVIVNPFTNTRGYYQEAQRSSAGFKTLILDAGSSSCTAYGATQTPAEAAGAACVTTWGTAALPTKDGVRKDTPFEAKCREEFDAALNEKSQPGVPSGDKTYNGVTYTEDYSPNECTVMSVLLPALKAAGKNPTWPKVYANILKSGKGPAADMSNGEGQFLAKKPFYVTQVHVVNLNPVPDGTTQAANGTWNGCPAPVNCWVPQLINGQEWFPYTTK